MAESELCRQTLPSPLGDLWVAADDEGVRRVEFLDARSPGEEERLAGMWRGRRAAQRSHPLLERLAAELQEYFEGRLRRFETPALPFGTPFQLSIWEALRAIPYGETRTYGQIARQIGDPEATRAVGKANGDNPIAIVVPCHRVIGADGKLTGYGGGLWRKRRLLELEGAIPGGLFE